MKNFISFDRLLLLVIVLFLAILFFTLSCNEEKPELETIRELFEENKAEIQKINDEIKNIRSYAETANKYYDSLYKSNSKTIKRFNYEISKMDDMFKNSSDSMLVNSVIRFWADRFYTKLPGFFQTTVVDTGITAGRKNISAGGELLSSE